MEDKDLEKRKEEQRQKIREIGQIARIKSLEHQLEIEKEANQHFEKMEQALKDMQQVVETWDRTYENTPEKKRSSFHIVPGATEEQLSSD